ncbi:UDP-3-O-glucosamine N-acyltransferase [Pterulicium gracile]|uniref:Translation initiation factor eIF2B subunit gamma n=1 Tax=Pterulicium gracile TaxID=1884261 RepID=A0A5C3QW13_9AGAR|nr:UDP-3-O-glucosamine N-acyltransferase [Pterula gracilis]
MDLTTSTDSSVPREFIAVILAGYGSGLHPLTSDLGDSACPKALLSIANKPMIDYTLDWIEQGGVQDVLIICPSTHRAAISHYIDSEISSSSSLRINIQTHDEDEETGVGTCAPFRAHAHRITEDFIVLPCDFVPPPSLPLSKLLNKFRTDTVTDGAIATSCWFECKSSEKGSYPEEWDTPSSPVPIVWHKPSQSLLHVDSSDEINRNSDELELRMSLLNSYPSSKLSSKNQDSGVYVCKRNVLDFLKQKSEFESFRDEMIPWLCKMQYQRGKRAKYSKALENATSSTQYEALRHSTRHNQAGIIIQSQLESESQANGWPGSPTPDDDSNSFPSTFGVGLVLHELADGPAIRVNTLAAFAEINRFFLSQIPLQANKEKPPTSEQRIQVSTDSIIGDSTTLDERTTIKKTVIGKHCKIGKMVKLTGCVILDHCVIEDGCKLDNCLLGQSTKVGAKTELSKCVSQPGYEVAAGESIKGEKLQSSDWTAAPGSSDEDEDDDDEDGSEEDADNDDDEGSSADSEAGTAKTGATAAPNKSE